MVRCVYLHFLLSLPGISAILNKTESTNITVYAIFNKRESTNITVYAGKGWNKYYTIVLVNESVNWYSAVETFGEDFTRTIHWGKPRVVHDYVLNLLNASQLSDPYLWVACIKSEHDNLLYSPVCKQIPNWKRFVSFYDIPVQKGKPTCAMFNTSNTLQMYTYGDCLEKHPFIVIKRGSMIEKVIHMNVSVEVNSEYTSNQTIANVSADKCISLCGIRVNCVGAMFNHINSTCIRYFVDVNSEFSQKHQFHLQPTSEETTFYPKTLNSVHFEITDQNSTDIVYSDKLTCLDEMTSTRYEQSTDPGCLCQMDCKEEEKIGDIYEKIEETKKDMYVSKKTLSSTRRKLTCADDPRLSSTIMGVVGITVIVFVASFIVSSDIPVVVYYLRMKFRNNS